MPLILKQLEDGVAVLTINNPTRRNALSNELLGEFNSAIEEMEKAKARVMIFRAAAGAKVWSAGLDITELPEPRRDPLSYNDPLEHLLRAVQRFPAPVIAMVEGGVWGGACDLAIVCDIVVGAPTATFAITPAKIGVPYNPAGILHFINTVGMHVAKEMFLTAEPLNAERALAVGILNHLVPAEELEPFTMSMARRITRNSPLSMAVIKEQLRILGNARAMSPETFERIQGLRRVVYDSHDYREGRQAFLEKRPPVYRGE